MSKVELIEQQIEKLSPEELATFRSWYAAFDAEAWDLQFEADVKAGKLDALADKALHTHLRSVKEALIHHASRDFLTCYHFPPAPIRSFAGKKPSSC